VNCLKCLLPMHSEEPHYGLHLACFTRWFNVPGRLKFLSLTRRHSSMISEPHNTSFFHGRFKKYSADLAGASYILKMREETAPQLPEVEYLCNQIGKILGVPVAEFFMINFGKEKVFVTKNFIKPGQIVDLQHLYHFRSDMEHTCEDLIRILMEKTQRPYDVGVFIKTLLFDALIGNHDRHGRNMAFIVQSGILSLSPVYDNVSYLGLESGDMLKCDFNPTGKISTKETLEPSMSHYVRELKRLGYQDHCENFYSKVKLSRINKLIKDSFCSSLMKEAMTRLIAKRYGELENEI
jgi:HipA-like C-terminal domain